MHYLVTNTNRIIAVDPMSGQWMQVGWAMPPMPGFPMAWTYSTQYLNYAVTQQGQILTRNPFGQILQIGHVVRLI